MKISEIQKKYDSIHTGPVLVNLHMEYGTGFFFFFFFEASLSRKLYLKTRLDKLLVKFVNFQSDTSARSAESFFIFENATKILPFFFLENSLITRKYI